MKKNFKSITILTSLCLFSFSTLHAEALSPAELDQLVKEDIATAQVLTEVCPSLVGHQDKINHYVNEFTVNNLTRFSTPNLSLAQLQQDPQYKVAYEEAKRDFLAADQNEQKQGCSEITTLSQ